MSAAPRRGSEASDKPGGGSLEEAAKSGRKQTETPKGGEREKVRAESRKKYDQKQSPKRKLAAHEGAQAVKAVAKAGKPSGLWL